MALTQKDKARALRWWGKQPETTQLEALKFQTDLLRQAKTRGEKHSPELVLSCLADASFKMLHEEESISTKGTATKEKLRRVHARRVDRVKALARPGRPSKMFDQVRVKFYLLVKDLREKDKFGWRNCATHLETVHNFKISHNRLREIVEELDRVLASGGKEENEIPS